MLFFHSDTIILFVSYRSPSFQEKDVGERGDPCVEKHMMSFITSCHVPGKSDCDKCIQQEKEALKNRVLLFPLVERLRLVEHKILYQESDHSSQEKSWKWSFEICMLIPVALVDTCWILSFIDYFVVCSKKGKFPKSFQSTVCFRVQCEMSKKKFWFI